MSSALTRRAARTFLAMGMALGVARLCMACGAAGGVPSYQPSSQRPAIADASDERFGDVESPANVPDASDAAPLSSWEPVTEGASCGWRDLGQSVPILALLAGVAYIVEKDGSLAVIDVPRARCQRILAGVRAVHRVGDSLWIARDAADGMLEVLEGTLGNFRVRSRLDGVRANFALTDVAGAPVVISREHIWLERDERWERRSFTPELNQRIVAVAGTQTGAYVGTSFHGGGVIFVDLSDGGAPYQSALRKLPEAIQRRAAARAFGDHPNPEQSYLNVGAVIPDKGHPNCAIAAVHDGPWLWRFSMILRLCEGRATRLFRQADVPYSRLAQAAWDLAFNGTELLVSTTEGVSRVPPSGPPLETEGAKCGCAHAFDTPLPGVFVLGAAHPKIAAE